MFKYIILSLAIFSLSTPSSAKNEWETQKHPTKGAAESIGTYSLGCVAGAETIPEDGYGWQIMRVERHRNYAHPQMYGFIKNFAKQVKDNLKSVLMVGDIGLPKGGPFSYGHRSHQLGLDGDFWFSTPPAALKRSLSKVERNKITPGNMVDHRKKKVNKNFKKYQRDLLKLAANQPSVDRIFVNPAIKHEMCRYYKGQDWLGKIRPWLGHDYHFHVRLKCPEGDKDCKLPEIYETIKGDGCDDTLKWWFKIPTKAEIIAWKKKLLEDKKKPKAKLPKRCLELKK